MTTYNLRKAGFTLVEIMIVVVLIGLLAGIALPHWINARTTSQTNACINNLRQIDSAKQQWALEKKQTIAPAYPEISSYLKHAVVCPAGGPGATFANTYLINDLSVKPSCQIVPQQHVLPSDSSN
jgi:prepilin-type N-terminal cleavage/methylation domain-containing protein